MTMRPPLRARRHARQLLRTRGTKRVTAKSGFKPDEYTPVSARKLANLLEAGRTGEGKWMACCPAHDDQTPSLSISEENDGRCLIHCFAGCTTEAVFGALQKQYGLRPQGRSARSKRKLNAAQPPVRFLPVYPFPEHELTRLLEHIKEAGGKPFRYRDEIGKHLLFVNAR